jgi:membrane-bound metal-dependent hydrolase YbcI (DUF457 family)
LGVHKRRSILFGIITFGIFLHLLLDTILAGIILPFYPFSTLEIGFGLITKTRLAAIIPGLDALFLLAWLYHEEKRHKISDFI